MPIRMVYSSSTEPTEETFKYQIARTDSAVTESLSPYRHSPPGGVEYAAPGSTQPTQPNPGAEGGANPEGSTLSPTQPNRSIPAPIWGVLEPSDKSASIYLRLPKKEYTFGRSSKCDVS